MSMGEGPLGSCQAQQANVDGDHSTSKVYGGLVDRREAERIERLAAGLSQQAPPWAAQYLVKAAPVAGVFGALAMSMGPRIFEFYVSLYSIYSRLPKNAASCLWGLTLCFYGGRYPLSLGVLEAFKLTGGSEVAMHLATIKDTMEVVKRASDEDDHKDEDADGTQDVDQIDAKQLARRKLALALRIVDPGELSEALRGLWAGYLGVIAALQTKYARTTALAHSIGESLRPTVAKLVAPSALSVTPPEYRKWVSPTINYLCKIAAAIFAWRLQSILSTFQSGLVGGLLAGRSGLALLASSGVLERKAGDPAAGDGMSDEALGWLLAAGGVYYQLVKGGSPPIIFAPILLPLDMLERWLKLCITVQR